MPTPCPGCRAPVPLARALGSYTGLGLTCPSCGRRFRLLEQPGEVLIYAAVLTLSVLVLFPLFRKWGLGSTPLVAGVLALAPAAAIAWAAALGLHLRRGGREPAAPPLEEREFRLFLAGSLGASAAVLLVALSLMSRNEDPAPGTLAAPGVPRAPEPIADLGDSWSVEDLEGRTIEAAELRGQVVFVNLWATWCRPCVQELPRIAALPLRRS